MKLFGPSIGIFELASLARGYAMMDVIVKKAPVKILEGTFMTPGKFFILFNGDEASVDASFTAVTELAKSQTIDSVLIPQLHETILPGLYGLLKNEVTESLGIIETATMSSGIVAADTTMKNADVKLIEIRSSRGIGGKCFYIFTGSLDEVQAGVSSAHDSLRSRGTLVHSEIISRPHNDFLEYFNISGSGEV